MSPLTIVRIAIRGVRAAVRVARWVAGRRGAFLLALALPLAADAGPLRCLLSRLHCSPPACVRVECPQVAVEVSGPADVSVDGVSCPRGVCPADRSGALPTPADPREDTGAAPAEEGPEKSVLVTNRSAERCILRRQVNVNVDTRPDLDLDDEAVEPDYVEKEESAEGNLLGVAIVAALGVIAGVLALVNAYQREYAEN